ncbi:hypothetical protein CLU93_5512 [Janthinobacterium sp. 35]|nr:hypothetical protein CLU93_5512 [Janthinobacterium sp. 35]
MPRPKRRMSAIEFDAIQVLLPSISKKRCTVARAALVDGETLAVVSDRFNCSRQAVNTLVNIFCDGLARFHEAQRVMNADELVPPGWERATLMAPSQLINKFRAEINELGNTN